MNDKFSPPPSDSLSVYSQPKKLLEFTTKLPKVEISVKTVDEILKQVEEGEEEQITKLEWIHCISGKSEWDDKNTLNSTQTSALIWKYAAQNAWLKRQLLWRLALYYNDQNQNHIASSFVDYFHVFLSIQNIKEILTVKIIQSLSTNNRGIELSRIACELNFTPSELITAINHDLPVWIAAFKNFIEDIVPYFCSLIFPEQQQVNWLLRCLNEMSLSEHQVNAVNYLLIHVSKEVVKKYPQLVAWVKENYSNAEKIHRLSEQARQKLREWIGAINYDDFKRLVNLILQRLQLEDFEVNQLRRRSEFWKFYSDRFEGIRILLPQKTFNSIGSQIKRDVDILKDDGSNPTEICIFDFGEWFVVEFFRGKGSETRLLPKNLKNQQILFGQHQLSVKQIRCLGGDTHDHAYLWQYYCCQCLASRRIYPNPGTQPSQTPTEYQLTQRWRGVKYWESEIERLEEEARRYCNKLNKCEGL
ncbi:hypothetical protein AMR41_26605 [Hapalosiphon sp. MRB220]|nr:hypothetical protein AMR41_26605 [Hapalosiphon sp. MRB220]